MYNSDKSGISQNKSGICRIALSKICHTDYEYDISFFAKFYSFFTKQKMEVRILIILI